MLVVRGELGRRGRLLAKIAKGERGELALKISRDFEQKSTGRGGVRSRAPAGGSRLGGLALSKAKKDT